MDVLDVALVLGMGVLSICSVLLIWNDMKYKRKGLPPGTMGWPFFGETREFLVHGLATMKDRKARYGDLFKTHVIGCPTIISMDPDLNKYILLNEKEGFVPGYSKATRDLLGTSNISAVYGPSHKTMRGALFALLNPIMLRDHVLAKVDEFMRSYLSGWDGQIFDLQEKTKNMAVLSSLQEVTGIGAGPVAEAIKNEFFKLYWGTVSLPINLPGTKYHRGLEGRKEIIRLMKEVLRQRRASSNTYNDMLEALQNFKDFSGSNLTEDQVIDSTITMLYTGLENFSTACMMASKYLHDNPKALQELRKEHLEIKRRKSPGDPIGWSDYKFMSFTRGVVYETLRLATVVNGVMRITTRDVELKGYVLPRGWRIFIYTRDINYDPILYPEPFTFNPWRWKDKSLASHPHFMLFGGGSRLCIGKELGVVKISMFLHYLVTRYSWEFVGGEKLLSFPRVRAPNGLLIEVSNLEDCDA